MTSKKLFLFSGILLSLHGLAGKKTAVPVAAYAEGGSTNAVFIKFNGFGPDEMGFAWFYFNPYNQQIKILPKTDRVSIEWSDQHLLAYLTVPQTAYYPVSAGDTITITKNPDETKYPQLHLGHNRFTDFEMNFCSFLSGRNSSIFDYSLRKIPNKIYPLQGSAKQYYERGVRLIDSCVQARLIGKVYETWIRKLAMYAYYNTMIWEKDPAVSAVADKIISEPAFDNALYRKLAIDYLTRIDLKGTGTPKDGYALIKQKYKGRLKDFLLLPSLVRVLAKYPAEKTTYLAKFASDCTDIQYQEYVARTLLPVYAKTKDGHDMVLNTVKRRSSLDSLLATYKGNLVYIDLWASWCAPCRAEMPASEKMRKQYEGKPIKFLFISIDENFENWINAAKDEQLIGANSCLLTNAMESRLNATYHITTIPRYILIDKKGKVAMADAPRPSDPQFRVVVDKLITQ